MCKLEGEEKRREEEMKSRVMAGGEVEVGVRGGGGGKRGEKGEVERVAERAKGMEVVYTCRRGRGRGGRKGR